MKPATAYNDTFGKEYPRKSARSLPTVNHHEASLSFRLMTVGSLPPLWCSGWLPSVLHGLGLRCFSGSKPSASF